MKSQWRWRGALAIGFTMGFLGALTWGGWAGNPAQETVMHAIEMWFRYTLVALVATYYAYNMSKPVSE